MNNLEIAWVFLEIADLLEIQGESPFKVRAYRQAAHVLSELDEEVAHYAQMGRLTELPGIGAALAAKIEELLQTGSLAYLERLRREVPAGLRQMLALPGVGPRTVRTIFTHLGISTLEELEAAARAKKLRALPGLGVKTELAIQHGIELLRSRPSGLPLGLAFPAAAELSEIMAQLSQVQKVSLAGDVRRGEEMVGQIIIVAAVAPADQDAVLKTFQAAPYVRQTMRTEPGKTTVLLGIGLEAALITVPPPAFACRLCYHTGPPAHWSALVKWARARGFELTPDGLRGREGELQLSSEEELYQSLGLAFVAPELRAGRDEVELAARGALPELLRPEDMLGDLHLHSNWSDGTESIQGLARAAAGRGYAYIAITDHSQALSIAHGLTPERLVEQEKEIEEVRANYPHLFLFSGIEVDILADGRLDLPDDVLARRDIVLASVHSGFKQDRETMTRRILTALANPAVDILAHPSGRLLGRRDPYAVDLEQVLDAAQRYGKILEINASPERLDLGAEWARRAKEAGIKLAINTDAHDARRLADMDWGVCVARRAGLTREDVVNAWPLERLREYVRLRRERAYANS
ncbi:MAG: polymerase [Bacillota bacterium]|nr:polymerase [Bacillota bacterium]MDK2856618.1 polymerase [Bacillota bacterium]MDK2926158.1 polymerase [Bacillota bacterium]